MDLLYGGIIAGVLTMLGYGIGNLVMKIPISQCGVWKTLFWRCSIQLFLMSAFATWYLTPQDFLIDTIYMWYAAGAALIGFLPLVTFFKSLDIGKVSLVVPVANSALIFTVMFSGIILGEQLDLIGWGMVFLIVGGIMLLSLSFDDLLSSDIFSFSSGVPYALFSSFGRGFSFVLFSLLIPEIGWVLMTLIISLVNFVCSTVLMFRYTQEFGIPEIKSLKVILIAAIGAVVGTASYNRGVSISSTNLVAAIGFSGPLVVVIGSYFLYQERLTLQQYIGVLTVVGGVIGFSLLM